MNSLDARAKYTRMVIEDSFLALMHEKSVARITVTELCQRAQINRATFYKHYLDIPDLMEKVEQKLLDTLAAIIREKDYPSLKSVMVEMLKLWKQDGQRYMILGSENGDPSLGYKSFLFLYEEMYPMFSMKLPGLAPEKRDMLYQFLAKGSGGVLTTWIHSGMQHSPEEVTEFILQICESAVRGVL